MLNRERDGADFNLIDDPWIPCISLDGVRSEFSLRALLHECHTLSDLNIESPLVTAGLYRLILALLHSALNGPRTPEQWVSLYRQQGLPVSTIEHYVERWRPRFGLFHRTHPFYQCSNFQLAVPRPATQLEQSPVHEISETPALLSPAQAARALVANQCFALGGGIGTSSARFGKHPNFSHAPLVGQTVVLLKGRSLFESLMFNLLILSEDESGFSAPAWERECAVRKPGEHPCDGYLELLTWQSRCVNLIPESGGVRYMFYAQGETLSRNARPRDLLAIRGLASRTQDTRREPNWENTGSRPMALTQIVKIVQDGLLPHGASIRCSLLGVVSERTRVVGWMNENFAVPMRLIHNTCAVCQSSGQLEAKSADQRRYDRTTIGSRVHLHPLRSSS